MICLKCSNILEFHLFADDTNLFVNSPNILNLETNLNLELDKVSQWLYANKLSLIIEKTSFVLSHSPQRRIAHKLNLSISSTSDKSDNQVKYLGLIFYSNLNWKPYLHELSKRVFYWPKKGFWYGGSLNLTAQIISLWSQRNN